MVPGFEMMGFHPPVFVMFIFCGHMANSDNSKKYGCKTTMFFSWNPKTFKKKGLQQKFLSENPWIFNQSPKGTHQKIPCSFCCGC